MNKSIRIEKKLIIFSLIIFLFSFMINFLLPFILPDILNYFLGNNKAVNVGISRYIGVYTLLFSSISSSIFSVGVILMIIGLYKIYKKLNMKNNILFIFIMNLVFMNLFSFLLGIFLCFYLYTDLKLLKLFFDYIFSKDKYMGYLLIYTVSFAFFLFYFYFVFISFKVKEVFFQLSQVFKVEKFKQAGLWIFYGSFFILPTLIGYVFSVLAFAKLPEKT